MSVFGNLLNKISESSGSRLVKTGVDYTKGISDTELREISEKLSKSLQKMTDSKREKLFDKLSGFSEQLFDSLLMFEDDKFDSNKIYNYLKSRINNICKNLQKDGDSLSEFVNVIS